MLVADCCDGWLIDWLIDWSIYWLIEGVLDPRTNEEISFDEAIGKGIINQREGTYVNTRTRESVPIQMAMNAGKIKANTCSVLHNNRNDNNKCVSKTHIRQVRGRCSWNYVQHHPLFMGNISVSDCMPLTSLLKTIKTSSSAVAKRLRDDSCLSVVSFNSTKRRVESFTVSYVGYRFVTACS